LQRKHIKTIFFIKNPYKGASPPVHTASPPVHTASPPQSIQRRLQSIQRRPQRRLFIFLCEVRIDEYNLYKGGVSVSSSNPQIFTFGIKYAYSDFLGCAGGCIYFFIKKLHPPAYTRKYFVGDIKYGFFIVIFWVLIILQF